MTEENSMKYAMNELGVNSFQIDKINFTQENLYFNFSSGKITLYIPINIKFTTCNIEGNPYNKLTFKAPNLGITKLQSLEIIKCDGG